ncbi:hypothetical protein FB451DRAFT_1550172 [Mycena latifolia]|nr:hypothetical protein FB451DRAFT_1550172 [Mycena latifolia]
MLGPRLQHQKSAKLLISRFESLGDHRLHQVATATSPAKGPLCPPKEPVVCKKDKSPIRQSFRNLLAVLKKGSGLRGKSKLEGIKIAPRPLPPNAPPSPDDPFTVSPMSVYSPQLAGSIFYLARSPETPAIIHPVWTFCSASLEGDTVHLTWPTTPSAHSILLKNCTDVRSLASDQLDPEEKALLPGDVADLKVFEILFDGCAGPEKFATTSVRERARWVSAIWDVILPNGDGPSTPEAAEFSDTTADTTGCPRPSTICSSSLDRALPPVPAQPNSPIPLSRTPSPRMLVPSTFPPAKPQSRASSICSRSRSPSIANLGHLSVVTQRLAQIERNQSPHPASTSTAPSSRNSSVIRTRSSRVRTPSRDEVSGPVSPTSILESYGEPCSALNRGVPVTVDAIQDAHAKQNDNSSLDAYASLALLTDIHKMVSGVPRRNEDQPQLGPPMKSDADLPAMTQALEDIDKRLRSDLPNIMKLLAEVHAFQSDAESKKLVSKGDEKSAEAPTSYDLDKLDEILELLKEDRLQRSVQAHQQTDSVRYLNELNSWLEAFVGGGTAQIQGVAAGVEKLCKELGCSEGENGVNLITVIRRFIMDGEARDRGAAELQFSVNNLATLIASESRNSFTTQSVADLIDRQRQDQEGLLRALTAELSNEIRGERLRFVDAMKEATAINVQMHVEQLKTELAREVRADLFAFYSKQKQQGVSLPRPMYQPPSRMTPSPRTLPNRYPVYP